MARDAVTVLDYVVNTSQVMPVGTAINVSNGAYIDAKHTKRLLIILRNTYAGDLDFTFPKGVGIQAKYGDLVVEVTNTDDERWIVIDSARFLDADGYINIDFETNMTGTVAAVRLPAA